MSRSDMSDNPHKSPDGQPNPSRPRSLFHVYFSNFEFYSGCQRNESVRYGRLRSADIDCPLLTNMFLFMSLSDSCDQVLSSSVATIYFNPLAPSYRLTSRHQLPIVSKIESRWKFHLCHRTKNSQIFFWRFFWRTKPDSTHFLHFCFRDNQKFKPEKTSRPQVPHSGIEWKNYEVLKLTFEKSEISEYESKLFS